MPEINPENNIRFSTHIQPIFTTNCIECHNEHSNVLNLKPGTAYNELLSKGYLNAVEPSQSNLLKKLNEGHPQVNIPNSYEKELIIKWMGKGAVNN